MGKIFKDKYSQLVGTEISKASIVIIDDGSTDQSDAIIAEYAAADSRIESVRKKWGVRKG